MKQLNILLAAVFYCLSATAQTDNSSVPAQSDTTVKSKKSDTMRIGNIIIIRKGGKKNASDTSTAVISTVPKKKSRITTNWCIVDLGFSSYTDKTNYISATADGYLVNRPGQPVLDKADFKLRTGKSVNVNIWFFMQQLNLVKENVSLKYGLGLELNNYRYKSAISYKEDGSKPYSGGITNMPFIFRDSIGFSKNKLAADYLTVPLMVNFATNKKGNKKGFNLAFGVSAGYLYSQRNKQRSDARGKQKNKGEYDMERFKLSYIGEVGLGPVKFYASFSPKSMYEHSLDMRPYNFGVRLSN
jgi:hypothetical protein